MRSEGIDDGYREILDYQDIPNYLFRRCSSSSWEEELKLKLPTKKLERDPSWPILWPIKWGKSAKDAVIKHQIGPERFKGEPLLSFTSSSQTVLDFKGLSVAVISREQLASSGGRVFVTTGKVRQNLHPGESEFSVAYNSCLDLEPIHFWCLPRSQIQQKLREFNNFK